MSIQFERRPFLLALCALSIGIVSKTDLEACLLLILIFALARSLRSWMVVTLFLILGYFVAPIPSPILVKPRFTDGTAKILSEGDHRSGSVQSLATIDGITALIIAPVGTHLHPGDVLKLHGNLTPISESEEAIDFSQGVQAVMFLPRVQFISRGSRVFDVTDGIRDDIDNFCSQFASESADWIESFWLRGSALSETDRENLSRSGAYSLVSASGLNVFVLWGAIVWVLGYGLKLDRRLQLATAFAVLLVYLVITGFHESTFRASITCLAFSGAFLVKRQPDLISITSGCGTIYLLLAPRLLTTLGFQLSMLVPIVLGFYLPILRTVDTKTVPSALKRRALQSLGLTIAVFLTSQPVIAYHTGRFGVGSLISSIIVSLVGPIVLFSTLFSYLLRFVVPGLVRVLMQFFVVPLAEGLRTIIHWIGDCLPSFSVPSFSGMWLLLYFGLLGVIWRPREVAP